MPASFNPDQINAFIDSANSALTCGADCQKKKISGELQQSYINSQVNLATAPQQEQLAQQEYVTYTQGPAAYAQLQQDQNTQAANAASAQIGTSFAESAQIVVSDILTYNSLFVSYTNLFDLYEKYLEENAALTATINESNSDQITSDRMSYYENQGYTNLNYWNTVLRWTYNVFLVIFLIACFIAPSQFSMMMKIGILVMFFIYPLIINTVLQYIFHLTHSLYSMLPKNAYL